MTKHQFAKECAEEIALNDLYANLTQEEYVKVIEEIILKKIDKIDDPFTAAVMQCTLLKMQLSVARDVLTSVESDFDCDPHGAICRCCLAKNALDKIKKLEGK